MEYAFVVTCGFLVILNVALRYYYNGIIERYQKIIDDLNALIADSNTLIGDLEINQIISENRIFDEIENIIDVKSNYENVANELRLLIEKHKVK